MKNRTLRRPRGVIRLLAAATSAVTIAAVLAACGSSDSTDDSTDDAASDSETTEVLRVGVQRDGVRAVLSEAGLLEDLPYEIEWSEFTAGPPIVEAASADQIDVAWVGSAPPIFGAAAEANFKIVAQVLEEDQKENSILVPEGSDISSVSDLEGKRVAVGRGTSAQGLLLLALQRHDLTLDDIEPNYLAPAEGLAAFTSGDVDAWVVWDPFVTQAISEHGAVEITGGYPDEQGVQFEIASSRALEDPVKRENIAHFVSLLQKAWVWAIDNPDAWGDGWAEESGLSPEVTRVVARNKAAAFGPVTPEIIAAQQELADAFYEAGELPQQIDFESVIEPGLID